MLKKIKKIWTNKWEILEGYFNYHFRKKAYKRIAKRRYDICKQCPLFDVKGEKCEVPGTQPCCGSCGCSLDYKVYCLSCECPEGYWHAVMTQEEEDALNNEDNSNR